MSNKRSRPNPMGFALAMTALGVALLHAGNAHADEYTDLLDILKAKGTLSRSEYKTLMAKHASHLQEVASTTPVAVTPATSDALAQAQTAAANAQASAQAAGQALQAAQAAASSPSLVKTTPYVPGKGVTLQAGPVDLNLSGFINGFYTYNSPGKGGSVAGGLSSGASGFDSSSVRNGFLPAALIFKMSTTQAGIDLATVFGMYPGLNDSTNGAFNANSGGNPVGLGTSGVDFRQAYFTAGNASFGTVKIGRDLGIFGSDAILNDATLLSVGATGSNSAPGNTSLGRIGTGYLYADWLPQITYISPMFGGFQATVGIMTPLDAFNYAGGALSASSGEHSAPMLQGKLTYDFAGSGLSGRLWAGFLTENQKAVSGSQVAAGKNVSLTADAGEVGARLAAGPLEGVLYYYKGSGLGTTGLFFDGIAPDGRKRDSDGYYAQAAYHVTPKFKLVASYGASVLDQASGESSPLLLHKNQSSIGAGYYSLTDWLTLVGEYAHTASTANNGNKASDNSFSAGAMVSF